MGCLKVKMLESVCISGDRSRDVAGGWWQGRCARKESRAGQRRGAGMAQRERLMVGAGRTGCLVGSWTETQPVQRQSEESFLLVLLEHLDPAVPAGPALILFWRCRGRR